MATTAQPSVTTLLEHQPEITEKASIESMPTSLASNTSPDDIEKTTTPPAQPDTAAPSPPPDGGLEAWLVVAGGFCTVFASFGWINCIGIFQAYYSSNQLKNYSTGTVSWIPSTESCMMFLWGPLVGLLTDNYGPRIPILVGTFLHVFGLMMTSISKEYYQFFLSQGVVSAVGCSFLFFSTLAATATWFARHRALAFGIVVSGSSIGGVILPIMVERLIPRIGFGWAMRATAFLLLGTLIIGNVLIKSRLPPPTRRFEIKEFITPFKERPFLFLTISSFFLYVGGFLGFTFLVAEARTHGMSAEMAGYLVPIMNGASTFGRIIPAQIADIYGVFNVMIAHTLLCAIFTLGLWLPATSNAPLIAYAILFGFTSGCIYSIIPAMVASFSDPRKIGVRSGSMYVLSALGALVGSPIGGAIVSAQNGAYSGLIVFAGVGLLVGAGFAVAARQALVGGKLYAKV